MAVSVLESGSRCRQKLQPAPSRAGNRHGDDLRCDLCAHRIVVGEGHGAHQTMKLQSFLRNIGLTLLCVVLSAHVGSPDAWFEGNAGPYKVTIQVQMAGV